jgi:hypothetical protein
MLSVPGANAIMGTVKKLPPEDRRILLSEIIYNSVTGLGYSRGTFVASFTPFFLLLQKEISAVEVLELLKIIDSKKGSWASDGLLAELIAKSLHEVGDKVGKPDQKLFASPAYQFLRTIAKDLNLDGDNKEFGKIGDRFDELSDLVLANFSEKQIVALSHLSKIAIKYNHNEIVNIVFILQLKKISLHPALFSARQIIKVLDSARKDFLFFLYDNEKEVSMPLFHLIINIEETNRRSVAAAIMQTLGVLKNKRKITASEYCFRTKKLKHLVPIPKKKRK